MLLNKLNPSIKKILQKSISAANQLGFKIYIVGGTVRDLCLGLKTHDLDLAVEGNALDFANFLCPSLGGKIKIHENFLSATIILPSLREIDITTARKETYAAYGALPKIEPGDIISDLKRRDFSINALAINLNTTRQGTIIDPCGGLYDLQKGLIKILHPNSFLEDPTRIFRAVRFSHRLKFAIEDETRLLLLKAKPYIEKVSGSRIKGEFKKIVSEGNTLKILRQLHAWKITPYFLKGTNINNLSPKYIDFIKTWCYPKNEKLEIWLIVLMVIYWQSASKIEEVLEINWIINKKDRACLEWLVENQKKIKRLVESNSQSTFLQLHRLMYNTPEESEIFILTLLGKKRYELLNELKLARGGVSLPLNGKDLLQIGFSPGPIIGQILNNLEQEVIKGNINTREEALSWLNGMRDRYHVN